MALLARVQPATAYQITRICDDSPVSTFKTSKGKVYPMIARLKARALVTGRTLAGDGRRSEVLSATARGREAIRKWMMLLNPNHLLPSDPLRTMVQSFDLLSAPERLQWISNMRSALQDKAAEISHYGGGVHVPYKEQVHSHAMMSVHTRLAWLDEVEAAVRHETKPTKA